MTDSDNAQVGALTFTHVPVRIRVREGAMDRLDRLVADVEEYIRARVRAALDSGELLEIVPVDD